MDADDAGGDAPLLGEPLPVELMNTIWADRAGVHDALDHPDTALGWLRALGERLEPEPSVIAAWLDEERPVDLRHAVDRLRRLRDALRRLAVEATGDPRDAAMSAIDERQVALDVLDRSCAARPIWSTLAWPPGQEPGRIVHLDGTVGDAVIALLAADAVELFSGPTRFQLRGCLAPGCVLYFVKQHPRREWCSAGCGNRARVARHYQRHRVAGAAPSS